MYYNLLCQLDKTQTKNMVESSTATSQSDSSRSNASKGEQVYSQDGTKDVFTLDQAKALDKPTPKILCTLADNDVIRFGEYIVRDYDSKTTLLHITEEHN